LVGILSLRLSCW